MILKRIRDFYFKISKAIMSYHPGFNKIRKNNLKDKIILSTGLSQD